MSYDWRQETESWGPETGNRSQTGEWQPEAECRRQAGAGKTANLDQFTINLTDNAKAGKIDPVLGRDVEIRQIIDILMRRRQNNPILTGEAGVGKTAVVDSSCEPRRRAQRTRSCGQTYASSKTFGTRSRRDRIAARLRR